MHNVLCSTSNTAVCLSFFFLVFQDRVSLCSPGCPGTHFVDQANLELRNLPASASRVLGLKACAITALPGYKKYFFFFFFLKIYLFIICKYTVAVFRHQKRASDLITDGCEPPCGCWDLNSGPSEEQSGALIH